MAKTTPQHNNSPAPSLRRSVDDYRVDNTEALDRTVTVRAWPAQPDRAVELEHEPNVSSRDARRAGPPQLRRRRRYRWKPRV